MLIQCAVREPHLAQCAGQLRPRLAWNWTLSRWDGSCRPEASVRADLESLDAWCRDKNECRLHCADDLVFQKYSIEWINDWSTVFLTSIKQFRKSLNREWMWAGGDWRGETSGSMAKYDIFQGQFGGGQLVEGMPTALMCGMRSSDRLEARETSLRASPVLTTLPSTEIPFRLYHRVMMFSLLKSVGILRSHLTSRPELIGCAKAA